jgi:hypothetical protein
VKNVLESDPLKEAKLMINDLQPMKFDSTEIEKLNDEFLEISARNNGAAVRIDVNGYIYLKKLERSFSNMIYPPSQRVLAASRLISQIYTEDGNG